MGHNFNLFPAGGAAPLSYGLDYATYLPDSLLQYLLQKLRSMYKNKYEVLDIFAEPIQFRLTPWIRIYDVIIRN